MKKNFWEKGFTLIELMVVVGIISILSVIVYASFGDAKSQSRDKVLMNDLKEVQVALSLYKAQNGKYPESGCSNDVTAFVGPNPNGSVLACSNYIKDLVPEYIEVLPTDSRVENQDGKGFFYRSDGTSYKLIVVDSIESVTVKSYSDEFARCPVSGGDVCTDTNPPAKTYAVYSKGAESW